MGKKRMKKLTSAERQKWIIIHGYDKEEFNGSKVNGYGQVLSKYGDLLKQRKDRHSGYMKVSFAFRTEWVHRLVCFAFHGKPENIPINKAVVNHIDGDKTNNKPENLEWTTNRENLLLAAKNGLLRSGVCKTPVIATRKVDSKQFFFESQKAASEFIGCTDSEVNKALRGKRDSCHGFILRYADKNDMPTDEYEQMELML